jgi:polyhydroxyalkanoate synthesis regulator protein
MDINQLQEYYDQRQKEYKSYLDTELQKFKDANNNYLSAVIAEACEHAKNLFENSNKQAFERFNKSQTNIEKQTKENYPETLLAHIIKSAKNDLDSSLKFNQSLFEQSVAYYKSLLKS